MGHKVTKWDKRFLEIVTIVTSWSKDPSTKCGAILVRPDRSIVSYGYNNFPARIGDKPARLLDREIKYELVVHSETNALLFAREDVTGYTMYCSTVPCCRCAMNMIQAGISRVVYFAPSADYLDRWAQSVNRTLAMFAEARIVMVKV